MGSGLPKLPCTCAQLRRASRVLTQIYDRALEPLDLKITQYSLLVNIARAEGATVTKLAERLVMDRTTLTRNLKPLERAGLVRVGSGADRRSRSIATTPAGRRLLERAIPHWREAEKRVRATIGHEDVVELHRLLGKIRGAGVGTSTGGPGEVDEVR